MPLYRTHWHCHTAARARRRAFTCVELAISVAILAVVMGMFVAAFESGSDAFITGCARGVLAARTSGALRVLGADLQEAESSKITVDTTGLPAGQCMIVLPSARDPDGAFQVSGSYQPCWQAVVLYCPYVTAKGVSQLRRYVYFDDDYEFLFPFTVDAITATEVTLRDALDHLVVVDRENGNAALAVGREFTVLCPGFTGLELTKGTPTRVTLRASCLTRKNFSLDAEVTRDVAHRN